MLSTVELFLPLIAVVAVIAPLFLMFNKKDVRNGKMKLLCQLSVFIGVFAMVIISQWNSFSTLAEDAAVVDQMTGSLAQGMGFIAAALATGCSAIGAGIAVAAAAPAAIGAISENSENFGKAIIFVALGEGVAIYGLLISILIINAL